MFCRKNFVCEKFFVVSCLYAIIKFRYFFISKTLKFITLADSQNFINGRLNDGFTIEDCKKVIDIKVAQWLNDPKMNTYLRPSTLFRQSKFEEYLNERMPGEIKQLTPQEEKEERLRKIYG